MKLSRRCAARLFAAAALLPRRALLAQPQPAPEFDVTSVKPSRSEGWQGIDTMPGRIQADSVTLERAIREAYAIGPHRVLGGPDIDTAQVASITVEDANGNPVPGATATSVSGVDYSLPASATPEPSSLMLLVSGLSGGAGFARYRSRNIVPRR